MAAKWADRSGSLEQDLRLRTAPVAIKFFEKAAEIEKIPRVRRLKGMTTTCQRITLARTNGWTLTGTVHDLPAFCSYMLGMRETPEFIRTGEFVTGVWCKETVDAKKRQDHFAVIPPGTYQAISFAPLAYEAFEPDVVQIYGTAAQIGRIISGLQWEDWEPYEIPCDGLSSCTTSFIRCHLTKRPAPSLPDFGERRYGHTPDDELEIALPAGIIDKLIEGLAGLRRAGIRYPVGFWGAQSDPFAGFPPHYQALLTEEMEKLKRGEVRGTGQ